MSEFKVGDGVAVVFYSDVDPYTVIDVSKSGNQITIQEDSAELLNGPNSGEPDALVMHVGGFSAHTTGTQRWKIEKNDEGMIRKFSKRKSGRWVQVGQTDNHHSTRAVAGRRKYYDYNF